MVELQLCVLQLANAGISVSKILQRTTRSRGNVDTYG